MAVTGVAEKLKPLLYKLSRLKLISKGHTKLFYSAQNPIYSSVLEQNVWGQALNRIAVEQISSEQAADEAITQIKEIFAAWR
jgi:multiple sugar transport system substrate-binding protein